MKYVFMIFIFIAFLILVGGHAGLYFSWVKFFHLTSPAGKKTLAAILGVLSVSFIITLLLTHWWENLVTNTLYLLASAWLGIVWYLALAAAGIWLIIGLSKLFKFSGNLPVIASLVIAAALIYSAYGLWNAWHPQVRQVAVTIKNLPAAWQGKKVVQISDVHLGAIHHRSFMAKVVAQIKTLNPDAVFITGDLFDGGGQDLDDLAGPLNGLTPPLGMYFITGNHETYINVDKALAALQGINIQVLRDQMTEVNGLQILGIDYPKAGEKKDIASIMKKLDPAKPNIVLYHEPAHIAEFKQLGAGLQLAGHTHVGQLWPFNFITQAVYKGLDYGLHQDGDYTLYTSNGTGTWGPPMRTGNRPEIVEITLH